MLIPTWCQTGRAIRLKNLLDGLVVDILIYVHDSIYITITSPPR